MAAPADVTTTSTLLLTLIAAPAQAAAPERLQALLAQHGCVDIPDDDALLRNRNRWWFSLEPVTGKAGDYAFYCQSTGDPLSFELVVAISGESNPWRGCDAIVDSWREISAPWLPYDLAVLDGAARYERHWDLGRWWQVTASDAASLTYGPAGVPPSDPIIDTTAGRAGTLYACYSGQWYRIGLD